MNNITCSIMSKCLIYLIILAREEITRFHAYSASLQVFSIEIKYNVKLRATYKGTWELKAHDNYI